MYMYIYVYGYIYCTGNTFKRRGAPQVTGGAIASSASTVARGVSYTAYSVAAAPRAITNGW